MMADTPSNYNIPNGRLDGKSLGLKAILMHAKKMGGGPGTELLGAAGAHGHTIDVPTGNNLSSIPEGTRTPNVAMLNSQRMHADQMNARMGGMSVGNQPSLDRSQEGGWSNINAPRAGAGTQIIGEESSGRENSSVAPGQSRKKNKKVPATNKTFANESSASGQGKNITPGPG